RRRNAWSDCALQATHSWPPPRKVATHRPRQQSLRPEQQHRNDQQRIEQKTVFLNGLQFFGHDHDNDRRYYQPPRIADATEKQDRNENERVGERVVIGRDESADHAEQRASNADKKIADQKGRDLPACDIEAEAICSCFVEPQRVEIEADPGSLKSPYQYKGPDEQQQADHEIVHVKRQRDFADFDIVIERPAENFHSLDLHALWAAENIVHLKKGLEQQRKCDGHHGGIVSARAQNRQ